MWAPSLGSTAGLAALAVLLAGCAPTTEIAGPEPTADEAEDDFGEPEPEITGPEEPGGSGADTIALELPGLPIGGVADPPIGTSQCVNVTWSGPPAVPDGVRVTVTAVAFDPPDVYAVSSDGCPGPEPSCLPAFPLSEADRCTVLVAWTGQPSVGEGQLFFAAGEVVCDADDVGRCTRFRDEVAAAAPGSIDLAGPSTGGTDADGTTGTDGTTAADDEGSAGGGTDADGTGTDAEDDG